jgi:hypothetical protein
VFNILFTLTFFTRFFTIYELYFNLISNLILIFISYKLIKKTKLQTFKYIIFLSFTEIVFDIYFKYLQKDHLIIYLLKFLILIILFKSIYILINNKLNIKNKILFYIMFILSIFHTIINTLIIYSLSLPIFISQYLLGNTSKILMFIGLIITAQSFFISLNIKSSQDRFI